MMFEMLVRSCLYDWLGYGHIDARIWFIGMEEGGAEIWRHHTLTLDESLRIRTQYALSMDFPTVWEEYFRMPLDTFIRRRGSLTT